MADRYSKDNILEYPKLEPVRHYESENAEVVQRPAREIVRPDPLLETLDDLDNVYKMMDLLPPDLARTLREITDMLSKHTQGLILMRIQKELRTPESKRDKTPPVNPQEEPNTIIPTKAVEKPDPKYPKPGGGTPDDTTPKTYDGEHKDGPVKPGERPGKTEPGSDDYKGKESYYPGMQEDWPPKRDTWDTGGRDDYTRIIYDTPGSSSDGWGIEGNTQPDESYTDAYVDDIFSAEPEVEIEIAPTESLVDLARKGYMQDDADIKEHYTTMMSQISQRFFQVMTALAEDCNMLDYSDLMQDFDGTAVKTMYPDQQHLIDEICRNQVLYDQKLRQMNLTHTAEKTLIMTRAMTAAEGERERYLGEEYKTNMPTISAGLSNDLLQKAREDSERKYKESAYNYYKYLDSATKYTNTMLNMKIDSAIAKAELANTGSNIFAVTPPPQPLPDNVDDNFDTTNKYQDKLQKMIDEQKKDSKKGSEVDSGISGPNSSSENFKVKGGKGNTIANTGDAGEGQVRTAIMISGMTGIKSEFILAQMIQECGWGDDAGGAVYHNYGGLKAGDIGYGEWGDVGRGGHTIFPDDETYAKTWVSKVIAIQDHCDELAKLSEQGDVVGYVTILRDSGYFAPESYDNYVKNMTSIIQTLQGN